MKQLQKQASEESQRRPMDVLIAFLTRHRTTIMITVGVIVVAVVALIIVLSVQNTRTERSLAAVDELREDFDDWLESDAQAQEAAYDLLAEDAASIIDSYPGTYAAARARLIEANALVELERWEEAAGIFLEVAEGTSDTYLAPVSLMDAAIALEHAGDSDRALVIHQRLADEYGDNTAEVPRALFSIGRLNEQADRVADAAEAYRRLIDDYPASSWTNLARNRIITLTVEGRIGG
ncbi:MAG: tetratricopeptide repeat protein [Spirochaetota bacterium]